MNERGDTSACRAAATTSSDGASLATKADAPASSAANSCSSPAYIVSTTIAGVVPAGADLPDQVEARCRPGAARR